MTNYPSSVGCVHSLRHNYAICEDILPLSVVTDCGMQAAGGHTNHGSQMIRFVVKLT